MIAAGIWRRARASRRFVVALGLVAAASAVATAGAQRGYFSYEPNAEYDGRYTFVRLRYTSSGFRGGGRWSADYPAMERNFMTILNDLTTVHPHVRESNIMTLDDTALARFSVAYLCEPGFWIPNEAEAAGLRRWLAKGGFLIIDDFYNQQWVNFERSMKMVLPDARIVPLNVSHPIFNSFFKITTLTGLSHPDDDTAKAEYKGIYEDNDPSKRLLVMINYNNDIGDYMEWSGQGVYAINFSNDAYKLATNYIVYGLTH
ncbi:MAG: DUF4159 domain-containing protein [Gemmatimonadaceae bacterium]